MQASDVAGAVALQRAAFPPPFAEELLWQADQLSRHIELFPEGQWIAEDDGQIIGSCSNTRVGEQRWQAHESWDATVGGPLLTTFDPAGSTLYGLDITVHPNFQRRGIGRAFYAQRFELVKAAGMVRYGTGCRLPGFADSGMDSVHAYAESVIRGEGNDRVLSRLMRYHLRFLGVLENYMDDAESGNAAALLEWTP